MLAFDGERVQESTTVYCVLDRGSFPSSQGDLSHGVALHAALIWHCGPDPKHCCALSGDLIAPRISPSIACNN